MRRAALALSLVVVAGCAKPVDPLLGRWDVVDSEAVGKGSVTVVEFADGKLTFERRGLVMGIGTVGVTTPGTYEVSGTEVTVTRGPSAYDGASIPDVKVREATIGVLRGIAGRTEGKPITYTLKKESTEKILLVSASGTLTLNRAR